MILDLYFFLEILNKTPRFARNHGFKTLI